MSKKIQLIIAISIAVAFFGMGYGSSFLINKNGAMSTGENSFQAGWDAAKKRLADSGFVSPNGNMEIKSLNGEIKEVNGDKITLTIRPLEPLADESLNTRIIIVNSDTKIYSLEMKDQEKYMAEMAAYEKKRKATDPIILPESFIKTEISILDLAIGQIISVIADKDIKEVSEFNAVEIRSNKTANINL